MAWNDYNAFLGKAKSKGIGHKAAQSLYRAAQTTLGRKPTAKDLTLFKGTKGKAVKGLLMKATASNNVAASPAPAGKAAKQNSVSRWEKFMAANEDRDYGYLEFESSADYE